MPLHEADRSQWRLFAGRAQYPSDGLSDEELLLLQHQNGPPFEMLEVTLAGCERIMRG